MQVRLTPLAAERVPSCRRCRQRGRGPLGGGGWSLAKGARGTGEARAAQGSGRSIAGPSRVEFEFAVRKEGEARAGEKEGTRERRPEQGPRIW